MKPNKQPKENNPNHKENRPASTSSNDYFSWIVKNVMVLLLVGLLFHNFVFHEKNGQPGYHWSLHKTLRQSQEAIQQIKTKTDNSLNARFWVKLGSAYEYLFSLKNGTPENAVILLPSRDAFFPEGVQSAFQGQEPYNKLWATRFLYPRRIVIPQELGKTSWSEKITHVAIVYGKGYEYLDFEVSPQQQFAVIPTHPQNRP